MSPINVREETLKVVDREQYGFEEKYAFGTLPEAEFLDRIVSAGIRQVCVQASDGSDPYRTPFTVLRLTKPETQQAVLPLATVDVADERSRQCVFSDLVRANPPDGECPEIPRIPVGVILGVTITQNTVRENVQWAMKRFFEGDQQNDDFQTEFMRGLSFVELQIQPGREVNPLHVQPIVDALVQEFGSRLHSLGLSWLREQETTSIDPYMKMLHRSAPKLPLHFDADAHFRMYLADCTRAIGEGAGSITYGMQKKSAYPGRPVLPSALASLPGVAVDREKLAEAYLNHSDMAPYFDPNRYF